MLNCLTLLLAALALVLALVAVGKVPLRYNIRNLTVRWKTTLMTALAFTLVVALLTVMLAFVNGMRRMTEGTGQPGNVLILSDGSTDEAFSNLSPADLSEIESLGRLDGQPAIVSENGRLLASRETYLVVNQPFFDGAGKDPKRRFLQVRGLDDPQVSARVHNIELMPGGSWFSTAGVAELPGAADESGHRKTAIQAVLGEGIAHELGHSRSREQLATARNPDRLDLGDTFTLGNREWIVCGILQSANSTFNSEIWAKRALMGPLFGKDTYTTLVVRTADAKRAGRLKDFLKDYKKVAIAAQVETDYYAALSESNQQFLYAIVFVTAVMAIGGIFGVMNTVFAAISQRVKDIGVLGLLGYSRGHILISFLLESLLLALTGGLLGCALGAMSHGLTATSFVTGSSGAGRSVVLKLAVDSQVLSSGILLSLGMGAIGGIIPPLLRAIRLKPLEALR